MKRHIANNLKMIDLFAGIGGFRLAGEKQGIECTFTSEWDKFAQQTYSANFSGNIAGDITKIDACDVPAHDILCAGFPCQAFSVSGKQLGFADTRGTLIYDVLRIVKHHKPKVLFLENVKNLEKHDNGRTFQIIKDNIEALGYTVYHQVLNASEYGVPQARHRIYIVCFRNDIDSSSFTFPNKSRGVISLEDYLLKCNDPKLESLFIDRDDLVLNHKKEVADNSVIQVGYFASGRQGERVYSIKGHAITLSAYGGGVAAKTGAYLVDDNKVRKLHPVECAAVQGFPADFKIPVSNSQAWKQFGNSVSVPVLSKIFRNILKTI
jgi:DNA (cytosine-5)-methyltransferase 1